MMKGGHINLSAGNRLRISKFLLTSHTEIIYSQEAVTQNTDEVLLHITNALISACSAGDHWKIKLLSFLL